MPKEMILNMLGIHVDTPTVYCSTYCANVVHTALTERMHNAFMMRQLNEYLHQYEKVHNNDLY